MYCRKDVNNNNNNNNSISRFSSNIQFKSRKGKIYTDKNTDDQRQTEGWTDEQTNGHK